MTTQPRDESLRDDAPEDPVASVTVNDEPHEIPAHCTVEQLLELLDWRGRRLAVAINRAVVPRSTYASAKVNSGDRIEILEAVGGG